jgi:hypothetical protein
MNAAQRIEGLKVKQARLGAAVITGDTTQSLAAAADLKSSLAKEPTSARELRDASSACDVAIHALSAAPANLTAARDAQAAGSAAISRAWNGAIHRAAMERLALTPSVSWLFAATPTGPSSTGFSLSGSGLQWTPQRSASPSTRSSVSRVVEPKEYEEALKVYFDALATERGGLP